MAIYDREEDRIIVRVVYDGLGNAGKSTNLQQLCSFFTLRRRSELYVPEERAGRTLYFDWVQVESGLVAGYRLRCQVLSVPGQFVLRERRARILKTADVVVLVCESTAEGVERVSRGLARTRDFMAAHGRSDVRFILQANKQDLPSALPPDEVARRLGFTNLADVVPARAVEAVGVRETIVLALRAAADRVQHQLLHSGIESLIGEAEQASDLYEEMRRSETCDPETLALAALLDEEDPVTSGAAHSSPPLGQEPASIASPEPPLDASRAEPLAAVAAIPAPHGVMEEVALGRAHEPEAQAPSSWPPPVRSRDVPSGLLWPPATARDQLRQLDPHSAVPELTRVAQAHGDGSGKSGLVLYRVHDACMKTHPARSFTDLDQARHALITLARDKQSLGSRLPPGTVLAIAQDGQDKYWLWTIAPWLTTLQGRLGAAAKERDEPALTAALCDFAKAAGDALRLFASDHVLLDLHPSNYAQHAGQIVYLDDELTRGGSAYPLLHAALQRVEEYSSFVGPLDQYLLQLELELSQLKPAQVREAGLFPQLLELTPRSHAAHVAHGRLVRSLKAVLAEGAAAASSWPPAPAASAALEPVRVQPFRRVPSFVPPPGPAQLEATHASAAPAEIVAASPGRFGEEPGTRDYAPHRALRSARERKSAPPLPQDVDQLPSGFIWPATKGRDLIRRITSGHGAAAALSEGALSYRLGPYLLRTSAGERFADVDEARAALLSRARSLVPRLGREPNDFVLVLVPSAEDLSHWLWTIEAAAS